MPDHDDSPQPRRPDAVRVPVARAGEGANFDRLTRLHREFAPVLGTPRVHVRHQTTEHFISGDPLESLYHPADSDRRGAPRYDWEDRGGGVFYGYLRRDDDAAAEPGAAPDQAQDAPRDEEYRARVRRWRELERKPEGERSPEEAEELARLDESLWSAPPNDNPPHGA